MKDSSDGRAAVSDRSRNVPPVVREVLRSPGQPLETTTRALMEPCFGQDFSQVRVHSDAKAAESARAVSALAFTVGRNIIFGEGSYAPGTSRGRGLLAHELTHTVQQGMVPADVHDLPLDEPGTGSLEREAERMRIAIELDGRVAAITERVTPEIQRLPGSPAGGCGVCYGDPANAGTAAHTEIEAAFRLLYPQIVTTEFPLLPSPTDDNGRLDLAMLTGPNTFGIGEIKPANPAGLMSGDSDLFWYEDQLRALGFAVGRLVLPPPLAPIPFPTLAPPPCPATHDLYVDPPVHGVYTYWCIPDFAELVGQCPCRQPPPPPVRVPQEQEEGARESSRSRERAPSEESRGEPVRPPAWLPPAVGVGLALLLARLAARRAGGPAYAAAALLATAALLASGRAEARISLEGRDPIEALFDSMAQHGTPAPPELQRIIENDPELRRIVEEAVRTGNVSEAQLELNRRMVGLVEANINQFSREELETLLTAAESAQGTLPEGDITVDRLHQALAQARAQGTGGEAAGSGTGGEGGGAVVAREAQERYPYLSHDMRQQLTEAPDQVRQLFEAMTSGLGGGPRVTDEAVRRFLRTVPADLTVAEARQLIGQLHRVEDEPLDEILARLESAARALRGERRSEVEPRAGEGERAEEAEPIPEQAREPGRSAGAPEGTVTREEYIAQMLRIIENYADGWDSVPDNTMVYEPVGGPGNQDFAHVAIGGTLAAYACAKVVGNGRTVRAVASVRIRITGRTGTRPGSTVRGRVIEATPFVTDYRGVLPYFDVGTRLIRARII
jgi:hypothetical protein